MAPVGSSSGLEIVDITNPALPVHKGSNGNGGSVFVSGSYAYLAPTGGVSLATARDFITAGAWALGVGADLVNTKAINSGERESVVAAARSYVTAVREARRSMSNPQ